MIKPDVKNILMIMVWFVLALGLSFIIQLNSVVTLFLFALYVYMRFGRRGLLKKILVIDMLLLFLVIFVASYLIVFNRFPVYYIPFAALAMLSVLLFNNLEVSFLVTVASAVAVAAISGQFFSSFMIILPAGVISLVMVKDARKRVTLIRAGVIVGVLQVISLICIEGFWLGRPERYLFWMINGVASSFLVLGLLPLFEYLFKTVTNISLLELADFHHPLLQRMIMEAPGTYHHSLVVGNLSEAACEAVGAHALLARIGSYYHDIGKLSKPEYFSENQVLQESKHDALTPTMSKLVIMNHVKEGVELAKKYRLNPRLFDFIQQHHGSSLVYYFYRRALEGIEEDEDVLEEGFRYPGPKPRTKETAIVLLADSVEAATRALKDQAPGKIEEVVHKVINNKFIDGQLDACDLTLKDLEKISVVFIRILGGIYHSRINYPEETRSEDYLKKSAKQNSPQSDKDKKDAA